MSLDDRLHSVIDAWIGMRKGRTLRQLAEETQLDYSTIKSLVDERRNEAKPCGETVLRLLLPILPIAEVHEVMAANYPEMAAYTKALNEMSLAVSTVSDLSPRHNRAILELSFGPLDDESLDVLLGTGADRIVGDLIEAEICRRRGHMIELSHSSVHFPRQQYAQDVIHYLLQHVNISVPGNKLLVQSMSLNDEAVRKAYDVIMRAETELQAIFADEDNRGNHKFSSALLTTIF